MSTSDQHEWAAWHWTNQHVSLGSYFPYHLYLLLRSWTVLLYGCQVLRTVDFSENPLASLAKYKQYSNDFCFKEGEKTLDCILAMQGRVIPSTPDKWHLTKQYSCKYKSPRHSLFWYATKTETFLGGVQMIQLLQLWWCHSWISFFGKSAG